MQGMKEDIMQNISMDKAEHEPHLHSQGGKGRRLSPFVSMQVRAAARALESPDLLCSWEVPWTEKAKVAYFRTMK